MCPRVRIHLSDDAGNRKFKFGDEVVFLEHAVTRWCNLVTRWCTCVPCVRIHLPDDADNREFKFGDEVVYLGDEVVYLGDEAVHTEVVYACWQS